MVNGLDKCPKIATKLRRGGLYIPLISGQIFNNLNLQLFDLDPIWLQYKEFPSSLP